MDDHSFFMSKETIPNENDLINVLGSTYEIWLQLKSIILEKYPNGKEDWNFPGKKYGWSFRIKDKKRAIMYFLPREGYFKVAFVFGQKAFDVIIDSGISEDIITELVNAKKYAEGRGIGIDVTDKSKIEDIKKLIDIKLKF